jgi:MoaD family protein
VNVRFHATLRQAVGGRHVVVDWRDDLTVWGFITQMIERYPPLGPQLLDAEGKLARHVHVMVNGRDAPYLAEGLETPLRETDAIDVFPPVGGGA